MGEWVKKTKPHVHDYPTTLDARKARNEGIGVGSEWRCSCSVTFVITRTVYQNDQRDGDYYNVEWKVKPASPSYPSMPQRDDTYYGPYGSGVPFGQ